MGHWALGQLVPPSTSNVEFFRSLQSRTNSDIRLLVSCPPPLAPNPGDATGLVVYRPRPYLLVCNSGHVLQLLGASGNCMTAERHHPRCFDASDTRLNGYISLQPV